MMAPSQLDFTCDEIIKESKYSKKLLNLRWNRTHQQILSSWLEIVEQYLDHITAHLNRPCRKALTWSNWSMSYTSVSYFTSSFMATPIVGNQNNKLPNDSGMGSILINDTIVGQDI